MTQPSAPANPSDVAAAVDVAAGADPADVAAAAADVAAAAADIAAAAADQLAAREGLTVAELDDAADHRRLLDLFESIWGRADEPVLSAEVLRVVAFECGYVAGASIDGELVAGSVGIFGRTAAGETILHSHITGAVAAGRRRHAGFVLKQHQRAWALARGITTIQWTFDPLVRRNAYFNAVKLAALPVRYLPDFYGQMTDAINAGHHSDRFVIRWPLRSPDATAAAHGTPVMRRPPDGTVVLLSEDDAGHPVAGPTLTGRAVSHEAAGRTIGVDGAPAVLVGTPADVERLRIEAPDVARGWRSAHRDILPGLLENGWRVTGFVDRHSYLLTPEGSPLTPDGSPLSPKGS
jgi:predicted GNAT superfamily acetyltransferase